LLNPLSKKKKIALQVGKKEWNLRECRQVGFGRLTGKIVHFSEAQRMRSRQRGEGWVLNKDPQEGWVLSQKSPNAVAP
jgi:hypothetical protein